ncbi:TetR/AcrR family transcriptional regulator C-terminal domain-containing protein [Paractinoplanes lichenicola]|uniref:TetR/AcrR family transcriptional regulator C-terminal domain-containing protein n=1 Tax=Paractinoplanes lichenicola TaxID=2802976 RepID=A0ABS1VHK9_9ACTN|nr:TetR/AcrR family transcriptional regulator C-terminal domain-containing protein [Actinoplanes lichenicola]MBL7254201.1 TetR/AcrR family transcriptional regulator C-terminal domain-containing protein [Actinoplanes lichenicola]
MALDRQRIVDEAVALLDAEGFDGVTTRKLAARLGVQSPTLYWHVPNKAALVTAIADAILDQEFAAVAPPEPDQPWPEWLGALAERLRRALLAHPDGARVVSAAQLSRTVAALSELAMSTLVARGIPLRQARVIVLTVERFTVGHVLEEQAPRPEGAALEGFDLPTFTEQHPTVVAAITDYFQPGRTVDDLFRDCLQVVIEGAVATAGRS